MSGCGCRPGSSGIGFADQTAPPPAPLTKRQRRGRAAVGLGLLTAAAASHRSPRLVQVPFTALAAWLGLSHVVAAATRYNGCPELGAIPSLVLGRHVHTRCGPWELLDERFELAGQRVGDPT